MLVCERMVFDGQMLEDSERGRESVRRSGFEPVLINSETSDLCLESSSRDTQLCCRTRRPGDRAAAVREGSFDHFLLLTKQCACHSACRSCDFWLLPLKPGIVDGESVTLSQDDTSLNYVLKFANVSRPGIRLKKPETLFSNSPEFLPGFLRKAVNKILHQQRNVLCSLLQRWHGDRYNSKPV